MSFEFGNQVPISRPRNCCGQTQRPTIVLAAEMTLQAFRTGRSKLNEVIKEALTLGPIGARGVRC